MIIAEIGQNFLGLMDLATDLIRLAKDNGADLVKLQLYDHKKLYGDKDIPNVELSFEQAKGLFEYGREIGIEVFFSVFDVERVRWCEEIGVGRYKLACGFVNTRTGKNYDVGKAIMQTGKELVMSFSRVPDINLPTYLPLKRLYCVPKYPAYISDVNFEAIDLLDGFSDHTIGLDCAKIALARGAQIIEKHFCIAHDMGVDAKWSMDASELRELKRWEMVCKQVL